MKPILNTRKGIPFFYDKSEAEFQQDNYEKYDPIVIRQCMMHLSDHLWGKYPMQKILDYVMGNFPNESCENILEIGCGVGRCIGEIAEKYPESSCWGLDFSYQMLKKTKETWIDGQSTTLHLSKYGFDYESEIITKKLSNLQVGLSSCENLPFADGSQDIVFSAFLLDRLRDPIQGMKEMKRVLSPNGKIIIITPLNFLNPSFWKKFHPPVKLWKIMQDLGLQILDWQEDFIVEEPLDIRQNSIKWNCLAVVCR